MIRQVNAACLALLLVSPAGSAQKPAETRHKVTVCQLLADPAAHNHQLIEVSGRVSHGFESFMLGDESCAHPLSVWLEYGGTTNSDTTYCCGTTAGQKRPGALTVEGYTLPLTEDESFRRFNARIQGSGETAFHATLAGRFFAGTRPAGASGSYSGYGHLGCCSLVVIQQVLKVEP